MHTKSQEASICEELSEEIYLHNIFPNFIGSKELRSLAKTCHFFSRITRDNFLWQSKIKIEYDIITPKDDQARERFKSLELYYQGLDLLNIEQKQEADYVFDKAKELLLTFADKEQWPAVFLASIYLYGYGVSINYIDAAKYIGNAINNFQKTKHFAIQLTMLCNDFNCSWLMLSAEVKDKNYSSTGKSIDDKKNVFKNFYTNQDKETIAKSATPIDSTKYLPLVRADIRKIQRDQLIRYSSKVATSSQVMQQITFLPR